MPAAVAGKTDLFFDAKGFKSQLLRLAKAYGKTADDMMRNHVMRFWVQDLIKFYPPPTMGKGKGRVKRDIRKLFVPMNAAEIQQTRLMGGGFLDGYYKFQRKDGSTWLVDRDFYRLYLSEAQFRQHHEKFRLPLTGRVSTARGGSEVGRNTKDIGRWKTVDKMHTRIQDINRYIRLKQKSVGRLKRGWWKAAKRFHSKVPVWVTKNGNDREGMAGGFIDNKGNGSLWAVNLVPYAGATRFLPILATSSSKRERDMKKNLEKRLEKEAQKFSAMKNPT
jgi:hypothetical protein